MKITDANTLIYDYTLESRDVVIDSAARDAVRGLLTAVAPGGTESRRGGGPSGERTPTAAAASLFAFLEFADSVFRSSGALLRFVRVSDETKDPAVVTEERARIIQALEVSAYLGTEGLLEARAESLWRPLLENDKARLLPRKTALGAIIPRMVVLYKAIQRATFGPLWIQRNSGSADASMIELTIGSKLGADYPGIRWTGKGKDIALVRAAFPRIAWTGGMAGVFRSDQAFHLEPSTAAPGKFRVTRSEDSRLGFTPVGMLTLQGPCCRGATIGGISAGVGLRSGAAKLDDGADLFLMATLGLDWLRVSFGGAYTAEAYDLNDIQPGDLVDSPNALNSQKTRRRLRPAIALHMGF